MDGLVFDIQRFSIHDGPGIRTTVFMQGCNLRCYWCHNPESQAPYPQVQFFPDKCIGCAECVRVCPANAQLLLDNQRLHVRDMCQHCGACAQVCFARALVIKAGRMSVKEVIQVVEQDRAYYADSGGGVTFSGGEPALQPDFLAALLARCQALGVHTAVDTAAHVPWPVLEALIPHTDLFLVDIKSCHEARHSQATGVGTRLILENLGRLLADGRPEVWVRIPVVPGFNDNRGDMEAIAQRLADLGGVQRVDLLPFHHLGADKYESLGLASTCAHLHPPGEAQMRDLAQVLAARGLAVGKGQGG